MIIVLSDTGRRVAEYVPEVWGRSAWDLEFAVKPRGALRRAAIGHAATVERQVVLSGTPYFMKSWYEGGSI